jgi:hypothetical protein
MLSKGLCRFLFQLLPDIGGGLSLAGGGGGDNLSLDLAFRGDCDEGEELVRDLEAKAPCESTLNVELADIVDPEVVESNEPFRWSAEDLARRWPKKDLEGVDVGGFEVGDIGAMWFSGAP